MKLSKAAKNLDRLPQDPFEKNTVRSYQAIIERYIGEFGDGSIDQVTPEHILTFLNRLTEGNKPYTKRIRYSQRSSFFNFVRNNIDPDSKNPCDRPMIRKLYRERVPLRWKIIEKENWGRSFPAPPLTATATTAASSCPIPSTFTTTSS
jgi:hypothetical protein